nr:MAG TPA: hypothetical protein [Caudoviricetes sp.]
MLNVVDVLVSYLNSLYMEQQVLLTSKERTYKL